MVSILRILMIEDSTTDSELIIREIKKCGIEFTELVVETREDFIRAIGEFNPDIILSDYALPEFDGMQALRIQQELAPNVPFILVTGSVNEETAVECMKSGADDYIIKQNLKRLCEAIKGAIEKKTLIREKEAYEAILVQSESRYRSLFENSAVPIFEEDFSLVKELLDEIKKQGITDYRAYFDKHPEEIVRCSSLIKIVDINAESLRFFNTTTKDEILNDIMTGFLDESWPSFKEEIIALAEGKTYFECEIPISTFNWEHKDVILKLSVRPDSLNTLKHVYVSFVDITARKQAQAALAESEELFRIASENAIIGVCMMTLEGQFMFVNNAVCDLWGYTKEDLMNLNFQDILHPEDRKDGMELLQRLASGEIQHSNNEQKYRHQNGSDIWASVSTGMIHSSIQRKEYFVFYIQDITRRKEAEISVRRSADLYCTLTENMKDVVWILDPETLRFKYISPSAKRMVGFSSDEIMGVTMDAMVAPEYREKLQKDMLKIINDCSSGIENTGTYHTQVIKQPCKDGTFIWAEITAYAYLNEETGKLELRGTHRDITERKNTEEIVRKSEEKFRLLYENAADPIQLLDENLNFVDCNEATLKILGLETKEQFRAYSPSQISPEFQPDGQASLEKSIELVKNAYEKGSHQFEWVHRRVNGELFTVDINLTKVLMGDKSLLLVHMRDITVRKQVEEKLREREKSLRTLINSMPDIVCFKDGEGRWLEANSFDLELFELADVDYRGKKDSELAEYNDFYKEALLNCEKSDEITWLKGEQMRGDEVIPRPDGTELTFDVIKVPSFDEYGNRAGLLVIGRDVTNRKIIEQALQKSEEKFRILAENASDVIWTMDIYGKNTYMSPSITRLRGYTAEEAMAQSSTESLTPETAGRANEILKRCYF
ncbi:MAG: PAS domain S-box protein [Bacteroidales bacterium]|nr:PAS domain S-box protein [Bacteroidales bacterium]